MTTARTVGFLLLWFCTAAAPAVGQPLQLAGAVHMQTRFDGAGTLDLEALVQLARQKGIEVLVPTDHDYQVMEYGLFPLRNLLKRREERPSVLQIGPERFLERFERINRTQQAVLVIPGVQSSPFYYWTGSPVDGSLTANDYRRELYLVGMSSPEDYRGLPLLHGPPSTRYTTEKLPRSLVFVAAFLLSIYFVFQAGVWRWAGAGLALLSLLLAVNHHPFPSSRYDPYHGDPGPGPYQELIDYVSERGGLVFWGHPESNYAVKGVPLGPVVLRTGHYPDLLLETTGYTGFEALYGDTARTHLPGRQWDRALGAYCRGERDRPPWAIAGGDFREIGGSTAIDEFQTVFLVEEKSRPAVLDAMRRGRMYAVRKGKEARLRLERFVVTDEPETRSAGMGETAVFSETPFLRAVLAFQDGVSRPVVVELVRNGASMERIEGKAPIAIRYADMEAWTGKGYYRLMARAAAGSDLLLSNPVFVERR